LNVFQPSKTEVVDNKASIATSLCLKTFSLEGKQKANGNKSCVSMLNTFADLFLKVKKKKRERESASSTVGKACLQRAPAKNVCHLVSESSQGRICPWRINLKHQINMRKTSW